MNQILISEKLYITPELKRKKRIYQIIFSISIICVILLSSYYVYAEYDRNKTEEISHEILAGIDENTISTENNNILRVALDADEAEGQEVIIEDPDERWRGRICCIKW